MYCLFYRENSHSGNHAAVNPYLDLTDIQEKATFQLTPAGSELTHAITQAHSDLEADLPADFRTAVAALSKSADARPDGTVQKGGIHVCDKDLRRMEK